MTLNPEWSQGTGIRISDYRSDSQSYERDTHIRLSNITHISINHNSDTNSSAGSREAPFKKQSIAKRIQSLENSTIQQVAYIVVALALLAAGLVLVVMGQQVRSYRPGWQFNTRVTGFCNVSSYDISQGPGGFFVPVWQVYFSNSSCPDATHTLIPLFFNSCQQYWQKFSDSDSATIFASEQGLVTPRCVAQSCDGPSAVFHTLNDCTGGILTQFYVGILLTSLASAMLLLPIVVLGCGFCFVRFFKFPV